MKNRSSRKWNESRLKKTMSFKGRFLKLFKNEAQTATGNRRMELWNEKTKGK